MIAPTGHDIGRGVLYVPHPGVCEDGVITSFNERFVFVRYGADTGSKATHRSNLEWAYIEREPDPFDPRFDEQQVAPRLAPRTTGGVR